MKYIISGHEKFSLRYSWLPKAVVAIKKNSRIFSDEDQAIVEMGVGKNMVRSIKFWALASSVAAKNGTSENTITEFGEVLFGEDGLDPYLEDIKTLWLLHWKLAVSNDPPLLAWDLLLNRWHEPEIARSAVLKAFLDESDKIDTNPSPTTLKDHFDTFIHTYVPTHGYKGVVKEDNLDSPLVELELLQKIGDRENVLDSGKLEPIYRFRREEKPEISSELFLFCLFDFIIKRHPNESTLSFREIAIGHGSPGQIFKLPESDLRNRLENLENQTDGSLSYRESASIQQVHRNSDLNLNDLLGQIY